ncbi:MAG: NAD(P)H-dependent oxidoreductase, partial [Chloroflexota bacterium]
DTTAHKTPDAKKIISVIDEASVVLMAVPIYNYDVNAVAKNLLELGLKAWNNKLVGFLCAAGGKGSYMSVMGTANSLMLDFRCLIIPRFVYANGSDFGEDRTEQMYVASETIQARLQELAETAVQLGTAIESTSS